MVVAAVGAWREPGHQRKQVRIVAAHQRQRLALVVGDVLAALAGLRLNLDGNVGHLHRRRLPAPTFSVRSMRCRLPTETVMFSAIAVANPDAAALMRYRPARTEGTS